MTLSSLVTVATQFIYLALGALTLVAFLQRRDRVHLDIALLFTDLGLIVLAQEYAALFGPLPPWTGKVTGILLMALPYLLLRLVEHFRPVKQWVKTAAIAGLVISAGLLAFLAQLPTLATIGLVAYFALVAGYAAVAFVRGALTTRGVTRQRMWLAAFGSASIAAVIVLAGVAAVSPAIAASLTPISQGLGAISGLTYYLGFAPPRWLRRAWQLNELHRFLRESARKPAQQRGDETLPFLCRMAVNATGGSAAAGALWDEAGQNLEIRAATDPRLTGQLKGVAGASGAAWQTGLAAVATKAADYSTEGAKLAAAVKCRAMLAVPLSSVEKRWGVLLVFLPVGPLFPNDDIDLLSLFAEQSALALDQTQLLATQRALIDEERQLTTALKDRTAELEAANRELEAFSYTVSHDLRAPLRHIQAYTDLLRQRPDDPKRGGQLERIAAASERMGRLIDSLLAFSRLGRAEMRHVSVPLSRVVDEARQEMATDIGQRQVVWNVATLPAVPGDPDLLKLAFTNLMSNAVKYTRPRERAEIEIGWQPAPDRAVIFVRDNGVGFDMKYVDKLFGVFQRLHHPDEFEGVGIGLANVSRIIQRHGGNTWAEAKVDHGATFFVSLPLAAPNGGPPAGASPAPGL